MGEMGKAKCRECGKGVVCFFGIERRGNGQEMSGVY